MHLVFIDLVFIVIAFIVHNTLGVIFKIGPVAPDITLIMLVSIAFISEPIIVTPIGFFSGFLKDLVALRGFGVNALTHTIIGYLSSTIDKSVISNSLILMLAVAIITLISHFLYMGLAFLLNYQIDFLFWKYAFLGAVYNAAISPFVFLPVNKIYTKLQSQSSGLEVSRNGSKKA